ncbi:MAG: hypothetical protein AVDCRST_MAG29-1950, partial [uncultured Nocardioidaceae bacterium]
CMTCTPSGDPLVPAAMPSAVAATATPAAETLCRTPWTGETTAANAPTTA